MERSILTRSTLLVPLLILVLLLQHLSRQSPGRSSVQFVQSSNQGNLPTLRDGNNSHLDFESINPLPWTKRDEYSCGPDKPCVNGACCGKSGNCGYGPDYCGNGCQSNCNAFAECGAHAKTPGTKCPLNTCCSEFGFCGTTDDFCGKKCQSNCIGHPVPPISNSSNPTKVQDRTIGYYEAWSAASTCHKIEPKDLPLDALTHINFAFASIDPHSYQVVPMDASTPASLFSDTTGLKEINPKLQVFISIGGWNFSNNDTATQPVFGDIAADPSKRHLFATNVVAFMKHYAFDGIDIDWEYPGAPDRGGKPEDTANYVELLKTLREVFDASGRRYGLTITVPSSYWYLRWFDLPNTIKYVDWINAMTYDLHGAWDATNPIGSIVQGHTNLTEIKSTAELFWRVNIPPQKLAMGFGFYGRAFTLSNESCTTPGCQFKNASVAGPCTKTPGILSYYEIVDIVQQKAVKPTWDNESAVNYFTFDKDQWVSYDDARTFKQKVDWANNLTLGGSLIWASDLDDSRFTAHAGLLGRPILPNSVVKAVSKAMNQPLLLAQDIAGSIGQNCFRYQGDCVQLNDNAAMSKACGSGNTVVGWDDAGCGTGSCHCGKPICCPANAAPKDCKWRGDDTGQTLGSDCSGQCFPGEVNIEEIRSSWGGGFTNDGNTNKCARGYKAFCCPSPQKQTVIGGCSLGDCRSGCPEGTTQMFKQFSDCLAGNRPYCCPNPVQIKDCRWEKGGTDCSNAICRGDELEVARDALGQWGVIDNHPCPWGRQQAACCTLAPLSIPKDACLTDLCEDEPELCAVDADGDPILQDPAQTDGGLTSRNLALFERDLEKRTQIYKAQVAIGAAGAQAATAVVTIAAATYPAIKNLFGADRLTRVLPKMFKRKPGVCTAPSMAVLDVIVGKTTLTGLDTEHPVDKSMIVKFVQAASSGRINGRDIGSLVTGFQAVGGQWFVNNWNRQFASFAGLAGIGGTSDQPLTINDRIMGSLGSFLWPDTLMAVDKAVNGIKGTIMFGNDFIGSKRLDTLIAEVVKKDTPAAAAKLLARMALGLQVFEYLSLPDVVQRFNENLDQVAGQLQLIEGAEAIVRNVHLHAWWGVFMYIYLTDLQGRQQEVMRAGCQRILDKMMANPGLTQYNTVVGTIEEMMRAIPTMVFPLSAQILQQTRQLQGISAVVPVLGGATPQQIFGGNNPLAGIGGMGAAPPP